MLQFILTNNFYFVEILFQLLIKIISRSVFHLRNTHNLHTPVFKLNWKKRGTH